MKLKKLKLKKLEQIKALWKIRGFLKEHKEQINALAYTQGMSVWLHQKEKIENTAKELEKKLKAKQFDNETEKLAKKIHKFCRENRRWMGIKLVDFDMKKADAFRKAVNEGKAKEALAFLQNEFPVFLAQLQQSINKFLEKGVV